MPSYAYLCKKAGLPAPTGLAEIVREKRTRSHRMTDREARAWLGAELDAMVARGELYKTADGKYGLPEWLAANPCNTTTANSTAS